MTPQEVFREIERDIPHVRAWREGNMKALSKRARQMMKFPMTVWYDHESPRRNRYLCMSVITDRNFYKKSINAIAALQKAERGWAVFFFSWSGEKDFKKTTLLPHVFDRYGERMGIEKTGVELVKHYISHNLEGWATRDNRFSGRSVRYKGRDNLCLSVRDGVLLGEWVDGIFIAHTFITYDMATGPQNEAFVQRRDRLMTDEELSRVGHKETEQEQEPIKTICI
jgi:hypothetical protein